MGVALFAQELLVGVALLAQEMLLYPSGLNLILANY